MRIKVVPNEDRIVRDPKHSRVIPVEGSEVVASAYWRRLALDGDITVVDINNSSSVSTVDDN